MIDASAISCQKDASTVQHDQVSTIIYLERLHKNNANIQFTTDHCLLSGLTLSGGSSHLSTVCYQSQHSQMAHYSRSLCVTRANILWWLPTADLFL